MGKEKKVQEETVTNKPVKIWKRKNIHLVSEENDIKFHGPLSYRHLRIAGWFFLIVAQLGTVLGLANSAGVLSLNAAFVEVLQSFSSLMTPLFLFAAFAQVLNAKDGYRRLLMTYGLGAIGIYALFLVIFLHYVAGAIQALSGGGSYAEAFSSGYILMSSVASTGTLSLNIFIDLVLCTLVTFFINYHPSKHFQGKKIYLFRSLVALPIIYELASITIKMLGSSGLLKVNPFLIPLFTTKPPVAFFIFVVLAIFVKNRERFYVKHGKTHAEYKSFLKTNVNKLHFSIFLSFTILFAVALDVVLFVVFSIVKLLQLPPEILESGGDEILISLMSVYELGFGKCVPMLFIIPIIMFFDYTKTHENKIVDAIIPVAGIGLIILLYIEGLFLVGTNALANVIKKASEPSEDEKEEGARIFTKIVNAIRNRL